MLGTVSLTRLTTSVSDAGNGGDLDIGRGNRSLGVGGGGRGAGVDRRIQIFIFNARTIFSLPQSMTNF